MGPDFEVSVKALHPIERSQVVVQPNAVTGSGWTNTSIRVKISQRRVPRRRAVASSDHRHPRPGVYGGFSMTASEALRHSRIALRHGSGAIPVVGFGTLIPNLAATKQATNTALEVGDRHFDCAERYRNEQAVGNALREAFDAGTIAREDVFVTTKLWNSNHRPERVRPAYEASCRRLQVDYADCYLIHTPYAFAPGDDQDPRDEHGNVIYDEGVTLAQTWQALEQLVDDGACGAIGLSDISLDMLRELVAVARIKPAVVQVESHPYLPEWELLDFCRENGIVLLAFAPLGHAMQQ